MVDRHPQTRRVRLHEPGRHVGIVQDSEARLELVLGVSDLQLQPGIRPGIAFGQRPVEAKPQAARQRRHQRAGGLVAELAGNGAQRMFHR